METGHEHRAEQSEVFALGALDGGECENFEAHLASGCAICAAHLRETRATLLTLHRGLKPMTVPATVRARLLERIESDKVMPITAAPVKKGETWQKITGILAAGIAGVAISRMYYRLHYEPRYTLYGSVINLLRNPATRDFPLYGTRQIPNATGRFLWNESGEGHILATNLPLAPDGKMYAVWTIAKSSAPRYIGTLNTDANGQGGLQIKVARADKPIDFLAVSLEPLGTTAAPTGPIVLVSKQS